MKNSKDIIDELCKELSYTQEQIEAVVDFYWITIRKKITSLNYHRIYIESLGDFYVRTKPLEGHLQKQSIYVDRLDKTKFQNYPRYQEATERLSKMQNIYQTIQSEHERKKQIKNERDKKSN
jgi:nucleoid DNA-binding protein